MGPVALPIPHPAELDGPLEGHRIRLEPLGGDHLAGLQAAADDAGTFRWMGVELDRPEVMRAWVQAALAARAQDLEIPFAIRGTEDGRVLGCTRFLTLQLEHLAAEIGWTWVTPAARGTGVNVEAKLLLLTRAFETAGLRRVEFKTDARNERSRGALAALGARYEGTFRKHRVLPGGAVRDSAYYSVIDDEWPAVRAGLQTRLKERA